jgi:hypothetical protein
VEDATRLRASRRPALVRRRRSRRRSWNARALGTTTALRLTVRVMRTASERAGGGGMGDTDIISNPRHAAERGPRSTHVAYSRKINEANTSPFLLTANPARNWRLMPMFSAKTTKRLAVVASRMTWGEMKLGTGSAAIGRPHDAAARPRSASAVHVSQTLPPPGGSPAKALSYPGHGTNRHRKGKFSAPHDATRRFRN